ncbi:MAG: DUF1566 domain-containing protein [Silvanigrellaceae bacterium]
MRFSFVLFSLFVCAICGSFQATANPPKPSHSGESPWSTPLAEDRTLEFQKSLAGGDEVVVDKTFGWMWQTNPSQPMDWYSAYYYCEDSRVGGFSDWQLPSYYQLTSILDYDRPGLYVSPVFNRIQTGDILWSRDDSVAIDQPDFDDRWTLHVKLGLVTFEKRNEPFNALCVRGGTPKRMGPAGKERFVEIQPDIILDKLTNLKWTAPRNEKTSKFWLWTFPGTFSQANGWCYNSKAGGLTNWRLPTIQELGMILDLNRRSPSSWMPKLPSSMYSIWSSTRKPEYDSYFAMFTMGQMASSIETEKQVFGCVHE